MVSHNTTPTSLQLEKAHPISRGAQRERDGLGGSACTASLCTWPGTTPRQQDSGDRDTSCPSTCLSPGQAAATHVPLSSFQRKRKGLNQISGSAAPRRQTLFFPSPRKVQQKAETGAAAGHHLSHGHSLGSWYCWRRGHWHAGGQEQGGQGNGSCSLPLYFQVTKILCPGWFARGFASGFAQ